MFGQIKSILASALLVIAIGCDEPLRFDQNGIPHGSGERTYKYKSGQTQLIERYDDGELVHSRWFKPDGSVIKETTWVNGDGEGIYLHEDGSIRTRMHYAKGIAEGEGIYFDSAGNVTKRIVYHEGKPIKTLVLSSGELLKHVGQTITIRGEVSNTKIPTIIGVDVQSDDPDLRGQLAEATGILQSWNVTAESLAEMERTGPVANRGPGTFFRLKAIGSDYEAAVRPVSSGESDIQSTAP